LAKTPVRDSVLQRRQRNDCATPDFARFPEKAPPPQRSNCAIEQSRRAIRAQQFEPSVNRALRNRSHATAGFSKLDVPPGGARSSMIQKDKRASRKCETPARSTKKRPYATLAKFHRGRHARKAMKNLIGVIILAVICLGLAVVLITTKKQATEQKAKDTGTILSLSNDVVKATSDLIEQRQVNLLLTNDLSTARGEYSTLSNRLTDVQASLVRTEASLKASQSAVAERDQRIAALETQNRELDEKAIDLSAAITNLTSQITETQRKLDASEGDKAFLEKEMKRLLAEKAELERQFNDLAVLRKQVAKLKEELSVARRLEWLRKGLFAQDEQKGAQRLMQLNNPTVASAKNTNAYDLNVEVNADGSVKVIPPLTNSAAAPAQ
jgi:hypothetical protein